MLTLVLIGCTYLPAAIWDSRAGRYKGFFNRNALAILILVVIMGGGLSISQGRPGPVVMADVGFYLFIAIFAARVLVEWSHHHKYKVWLHRQYHKLTDHEDPREASP